MKVILFITLIALVASTAFAQYAEVFREDTGVQGEGPGSQQEKVSLSSCRDYVKDRCSSMKFPITQPWKWSQPWKYVEPLKWGIRSCRRVQKQCCEELGKMQELWRCTAIKQMIQGDIMLRFQPTRMSKVMQKAKSLPAMCKMASLDCKISMADGYY